MEVWEKALRLSVEIFDLTKALPRSEDYGLTSQIRRAASGISAAIAEGFGRKTKKDKNYFYMVSRSSAFETQSHLIYGNKISYFENEETERLLKEYDELIHQLNKVMKSLS